MTLEVVHRHEKFKLAPKFGVEFRLMAPISGACVRGLRPVNESIDEYFNAGKVH